MIWLSYLWLAVNAGFLAGWICASEYHRRTSRKPRSLGDNDGITVTRQTYARRDQWGS